MKRISVLFIVFIILISSTCLAVTPNGSVIPLRDLETPEPEKMDYKKEDKKRMEASQKALETLLEKYKTEEVPEDERIKEYYLGGYTVSSYENETTEFKATISFTVTPYLEESTFWEKGSQMCFAEFDRIDGEYILRWIDLKPRNYDKFEEAFNEYQNTVKCKEDETIVEPTGNKLNNEQKEVEKLSKIIFIVSSTILIIIIIILIIKKIKR